MKKLILLTLMLSAIIGIYAVLLNESFTDTVFPPADWSAPATAWGRYTTYYNTTPACAKSGYSSGTWWLVTPKLKPVAGANTLTFWYRDYSADSGWDYADEYTYVMVSTTTDFSAGTILWTGDYMTFTTTWQQASISLSAYNNTEIFIAFKSIHTGGNYRMIDDVTGVDLAPAGLPNPAVLVSPTPSGVTGVLATATLNWANGGGGTTGYKLQYGTNPAADNILPLTNMDLLTTYDPAGLLTWGQTYYWKVVPYSPAGDCTTAPIWSFTVMSDPTIILPPEYTQDFGTTGVAFPPTNWNKYSGVLASPTVLGSAGTGSWFQRNWRNVTADPVNYGAVINIYSTINGWLISPPISVPGSDYELKFDLALTDYYTSNPITSDPNGTTGVDDVFAVLIGDGTSWTPANVVRQWDNAGSPYVYNNISSLGETVILSLGAPGVKYVAFYGISTVSNADNDLFVDNVVLRQTPTSAIFNLSPDVTSWDFGLVPVNIPVTKTFRVTNTGGAPLTFSSIGVTGTGFSADPPFDTTPIPATQFRDFTVKFLPTAVQAYTGALTFNFTGGPRTVALSGSAYTPTTMPVTEGFESGFGNFIVLNGTQTNQWYTGTATFYAGAQSAYITNDAGVSNTYTITATSVVHMYQDVLFTPGAEQYNLSFAWKGQGESSSYDYLQVFLVDTATTPVAGTRLTTGQIGVNYNLQSTWQNASIAIPNTNAGQVKRLVFSWWNDSSVGTQPPIAVDAISLTAILPSAPDPVTLTYPANGATGLPKTGFNLTWTPASTGGIPTGYTVYLADDETQIYDQHTWNTSNTYFNPVTEGSLPFNYLDHWYWTVEATNGLGSAVVEPPFSFTIEPDPLVNLPYPQDFGTTLAWPTGWTQTSTGSNVWSVTATANAGGTADEMTATWVSLVGTTRLISPPINTTGVAQFLASFNHYYNDYGAGITAKLQYSHDLNTWYDTPWSIVSGGGDVSGYTNVLISGLAAPTTYVAWVLDGDHFQYDYWYVDDVLLAPVPDHDVGVVSWDYPVQVVVQNTSVIPVATVGNFGLNTETFTVTCTIGAYSQTQTVTGLASFANQQVSFPALIPALGSLEQVVITTTLATDTVALNNTLYDALACVELHTPALAMNAQTNEFVQFNLATPGTLNPLPTLYTGTYFMSGGDWMNGNWMGVEYDVGTLATDNYYEIDPLTGVYLPSLGEPGQAFMGIAYNENTGVLYGVTGTSGSLYTMDPLTGLAGTGGALWYNLDGTPTNLPDINGLMIDIAYDNNPLDPVLYGIDLGNDCLWTINPATYELTLVGFFGIDINYAQDAAFDQVNGLLFLTGYSTFGGLYWIDTEFGGAYLVGPLGTASYEMDAFAIPYGAITAPVVTIAATGELSWPAVTGAIQYQVYKAATPYGTYAPYATVYGTTWTDPLFAEGMAFYKVSAVGGMRGSNRLAVQSSSAMRKSGKLGVMKRTNTGIAR